MKNNRSLILLLGIVLQFVLGCSNEWTKAIQSGEITQKHFYDTIPITTQIGLIFIPVTINGSEYRFLFDSGAPLSISMKLQENQNFDVVSKGHIVDSDHNRQKVIWCNVDSLALGVVVFKNQTAFVGDFDANPLFSCLKIDGIIGSNLIRQCNWTLDLNQHTITTHTEVVDTTSPKLIELPFKTDFQYNIFTDIKIGRATVKDVLIDYDSNGSITLDNQVFSTLKENAIIEATFKEKGIHQSGIIGMPVTLNREISYSDSVALDTTLLIDVALNTGKTTSIGTKFLSRFKVTIDWEKRKLYLLELDEFVKDSHSPGFKLGYSAEKGIYVQSLIERSNAYSEGVKLNMKVIKLDGLDFEGSHTFCDYVKHEFSEQIFLELIDSEGNRITCNFEQMEI